MMILTQQSRLGKTKLWKVWVEGATVHIEHGFDDGKKQHTEDTKKAKNVGRANEKSPETVAQEDMERLIKLKMRNGYVEQGQENKAADTTLDINQPLPEGLCFYKPANSMSKFMTGLLEDEELAWAVRKRDGNMMILHKTLDNKVYMYSRKMLTAMDKEPDRPFTERFSHIAEEFSMIAPAGSIILGELVAWPDKDSFNHVGTLLKSKTDKSISVQQDKGWACFYVWDIAWWSTVEVLSEGKIGQRLMLAQREFRKCDFILIPDIWSVEDLEEEWSIECLQKLALERGWEGFVIINPDGVFGDRAWNLRGKSERAAKVSCKLKPTLRDEFIAYWEGEYGTGKHQDGIKALTLYQYTEAGIMTEVGKVSGGLTDEQKKELADPDLYPKVVEVEFHEWTDKKKLRIPTFIRWRDDKEPLECVNPELG